MSTVRRKDGAKAPILFLIALLLAISLGQAVFGAPDVTFGDVNDDGKIDVRDVVMVMQYILELKELDSDQIKAADVTGDGKIDINDVNQIMQYILGLIDRFTVHSSIKSVEEVEFDVSYGTAQDNIGLPAEVEITLYDNSSQDVSVKWEDTSTPEYQQFMSGDYVFRGELDQLPQGVFNPKELKATAVVNVGYQVHQPQPAPDEFLITGVEALAAIVVSGGTNFNDIGLPSEVEVTFDDNSTSMLDVDWDEGDYDGDVAGNYTLEGDLVLPVGVTNPYDHTASVDVTVRGEVDNVYNVEKEEWYENISSAIVAADPDNTLLVYPGTYAEAVDQIVINKNLSIIGVNKNTTIIKPAQDTGSAGDARGWFLVEAGNEFNLSNMTLDGEGKNVHQAIRSYGSGTIDSNIIKNIKYSKYYGLGMVGMNGSDMTISNNTFTNIERIGMMAFGTGTTAEMIGNTYTGKGLGDFLDYGIEIGGGASATITGNTITNCGPSTIDGSASAGILVNSLYVAPGEVSRAVITNNTLTNNENGIIVGVGVDTPDEVIANFNNISGNSWGLRSFTAIPLDATNNWWGHESGPGGEGPGSGDEVTENVIYDPWADSPF